MSKATTTNNLYKPIITGSIAGAVGYVGTLPLDLLKQHLQSNHDAKQVYKNIQHNIKMDGFKYLFRGGLLGCYSIIPQMAIKFTCNDLLTKNTNNNSYTNGFISGYMDGSFLGPILSITSLQQMRKEFGYKEAINIFRSVRILPLTVPLALRNATYTSILFGGLKSSNADNTFFNNFLISSALNVPGVLACSPFDVVRAHQINNMILYRSECFSAIELYKKTNPINIAKSIYIKNGFKGFYQGVGSLYINFAIRFPITFSIFLWLNKSWI